MTELTDKELPYSLEAEQTVLGALLLEPDAISTVLNFVKPDYFYIKKHKDLFSIIIRLFSMGTSADIITVLNEATAAGVFDEAAAGKQYLATIMNGVPSVSNIESYCRIIEGKYYVRTLMTTARDIINMCSENQENPAALLDAAEQMMYDIRQGRDLDGLTKIEDVIVDTYDQLQKITGPDKDLYLGAKSGFSELDTIITGLNKSDLILVAARPGMGKTSFALNIATNMCRYSKNKDVAVFSLEMGKEQLASRMLSSESLVNSNSLRTGRLSADDWKNLAIGAQHLSGMPIYLDDTGNITVVQMKAKLRRLKNLGLVIIDYLQLMNSGRRIDNRVQEISEITRQLKLMAKELNVPVITLSQLSRAVESRTDKRPVLSDLRESGSIEQDADIVMFLYRDGYYNKQAENQNLSECIVSKNRHGETGTISLMWDGQFTRFSSPEMYRLTE